MNKQEAQQRITNLENELAALKAAMAETEKLKLWSLEPKGDGFFVGCTGSTFAITRSSDNDNLNRFGNSFQTMDQAEKAAPLMARSNKIIKAAGKVDADAGPWQRGVREWAVYFDLDGRWEAIKLRGVGMSIACVHTEEQAKLLAEILNNEGI